MDCSICTNAIDGTTSSTRLTCGHTFHFGCLATWATTAQTCPMCRHSFGETESIERLEPEPNRLNLLANVADSRSLLMSGFGGQGRGLGLFDALLRPTIESRGPTPAEIARFQLLDSRRPTFADLTDAMGQRTMWRPRLRRELEERYNRRPLEEVSFDGPDPLDIEMVMDHAGVSWDTAQRYLAYHGGDVVETVMCFATSTTEYPIPEFRERERPVSEEPYVSRDIHNRVGMTARTVEMHDERGYETS